MNKTESNQNQEVSVMAQSIFTKVREIKSTHPEVSRNIDLAEREIRERLELIKREIQKLDKKEQDLVKVLVINGLYRTADEVLVD